MSRYLLLLLAGCLGASAAGAAELDLTFENLAPRGTLMLEILDSEAALKGKAPALAQIALPVSSDRLRIRTDALIPGIYGVRVFQDLDGDRTLDANLLGIPKEPWAFSNNAAGQFGPPGWEAVQFELNDSIQQSIRMVQ